MLGRATQTMSRARRGKIPAIKDCDGLVAHPWALSTSRSSFIVVVVSMTSTASMSGAGYQVCALAG